jgi:hypothetical protein
VQGARHRNLFDDCRPPFVPFGSGGYFAVPDVPIVTSLQRNPGYRQRRDRSTRRVFFAASIEHGRVPWRELLPILGVSFPQDAVTATLVQPLRASTRWLVVAVAVPLSAGSISERTKQRRRREQAVVNDCEREITRLVSEGWSNKAIARRVNISHGDQSAPPSHESMAATSRPATVGQLLRHAPTVPDASGTPDGLNNLGGAISWINSRSASVSNGLRSILKFEGAALAASL